jgi:hypothetical protein
MNQRIYRVTKDFKAQNVGSDGVKIIKKGQELCADSNQAGDTMVFRIDNIFEFEVDSSVFKASTEKKPS